MLRLIRNAFDDLNRKDPNLHHIQYYLSEKEILVASNTPHSFQLYAVFTPTLPVSHVHKGLNHIVHWVKEFEDNLFLLESHVFDYK